MTAERDGDLTDDSGGELCTCVASQVVELRTLDSKSVPDTSPERTESVACPGMTAHAARPHLLHVAESKGFAVFDRGRWNLNVIGTRHPNRTAGTYDDVMNVIGLDNNDRWFHRSYAWTLDSGRRGLLKPVNRRGTGIIAEGQYRGAWRLGQHGVSGGRTGYRALVQCKPIRVHRDDNRDLVLNTDIPTVMAPALSRINCHASSNDPYKLLGKARKRIGPWSVACMAAELDKDFVEFMQLCERQNETGLGPYVTISIINAPQPARIST
ncbi:MAG: hypothetical protein ACJAV2_004968 [Myxococcota bacterium]